MDFNLNDILASFKSNMEIPKGFDFLAKYDKNKNSIFDTDEIEDIKQALTDSAKKDGIGDELSEEEMLDFYNKSYEKGKQATVTNLYSESFKMVNNWLLDLLGITSNVEEKLKNTDEYKNLSDKRKECVDIYLENLLRTGDIDFDNYHVEELIRELSSEKFSDEQIEELLPVMRELNRIPTVSIRDFIYDVQANKNLMKNISKEHIDYVIEQQLYNVFEYQSRSIVDLLSMEHDDFEKSKPFLEIDNLEEKPDAKILKRLIQNSKSYERVVELIENNKLNEITYDAVSLILLDDEKYEKASRLLGQEFETSSEESYKVGYYGAIQLTDLNEEQLETFKKLLKTDIKIDGLFNSNKIEFAKLPEERRNRVIQLSNIENRTEVQHSYNDLWNLSNVNEKSLDDFIKNNPNFSIVHHGYGSFDSPTKNISLKSGNKEFLFDYEKGLVEVKTTEYNPETKEIKVSLENTLSNIKQEIFYENCEDEYPAQGNLKKEVTEYYNSEGKLLRTEVAVANEHLKGLPNRSVIYPNGKQETVQFASYDPATKARYAEKHFTSPEGVKTDYYYEETPDNTRIIDYTITDKNGKILMQRHNTFQQISEGHVVTSVNGHGYDIYLEADSIKIIDSKNRDKTNIINLKDVLFTVLAKPESLTEEEKAAKIDNLKKCLMAIPGNLLLLMKDFPISELTYNDREENNGKWSSDTRDITLNRYTLFSTSELEALQNVFMHEYGHYADSTADGDKHDISEDPMIQQIYEEELEQFRKNSTSVQQTFLSHIINDSVSEKAADATHSLYAQEPSPHTNMRLMYYQMSFPRTIAAIADRYAQKEQEVALNE